MEPEPSTLEEIPALLARIQPSSSSSDEDDEPPPLISREKFRFEPPSAQDEPAAQNHASSLSSDQEDDYSPRLKRKKFSLGLQSPRDFHALSASSDEDDEPPPLIPRENFTFGRHRPDQDNPIFPQHPFGPPHSPTGDNLPGDEPSPLRRIVRARRPVTTENAGSPAIVMPTDAGITAASPKADPSDDENDNDEEEEEDEINSDEDEDDDEDYDDDEYDEDEEELYFDEDDFDDDGDSGCDCIHCRMERLQGFHDFLHTMHHLGPDCECPHCEERHGHEEEDGSLCSCENCEAERMAKRGCEDCEDDDFSGEEDTDGPRCAICFRSRRKPVVLPCCATQTSTMQFCYPCVRKTLQQQRLNQEEMHDDPIARLFGFPHDDSFSSLVGECPRCRTLISCTESKETIDKASTDQVVKYCYRRTGSRRPFFVLSYAANCQYLPVELFPDTDEADQLSKWTQWGLLSCTRPNDMYAFDPAKQQVLRKFIALPSNRPDFMDPESGERLTDPEKWQDRAWMHVFTIYVQAIPTIWTRSWPEKFSVKSVKDFCWRLGRSIKMIHHAMVVFWKVNKYVPRDEAGPSWLITAMDAVLITFASHLVVIVGAAFIFGWALVLGVSVWIRLSQSARVSAGVGVFLLLLAWIIGSLWTILQLVLLTKGLHFVGWLIRGRSLCTVSAKTWTVLNWMVAPTVALLYVSWGYWSFQDKVVALETPVLGNDL